MEDRQLIRHALVSASRVLNYLLKILNQSCQIYLTFEYNQTVHLLV